MGPKALPAHRLGNFTTVLSLPPSNSLRSPTDYLLRSTNKWLLRCLYLFVPPQKTNAVEMILDGVQFFAIATRHGQETLAN